MPRREPIAVTIYLPADLYEWLVLRKARGHGALTRQVTGYCEEGRIRAELADAADQIEPAPGGLERIQERIRQEGT
jgi:hypothetical protein